MKYRFLFLVLLCCHQAACGQSADSLLARANRLYEAKSFERAGQLYVLYAGKAELKVIKQSACYNAACCYTRTGNADSALLLLRQSIQLGFKDRLHLLADHDLVSLHELAGWKAMVGKLSKIATMTNAPDRAALITADVSRYWKARDLAQKDTADRYAIYKKYYVDSGSDGLQDYFAYKIGSLATFVSNQDSKPKFYAAIKKNTYLAERVKPAMTKSFENFKSIYPAAVFPNVYLVMGAFTSGGSSTSTGLLIGLDMAVRTPDIPLDELSPWERNNFVELQYLEPRIAHELIHFNQGAMARDTTLLCAALFEGMADFMGELISGKNANERLQHWAKGREGQIMAAFKKEMYLDRAGNWIGNGDQETPDKPADLGYWAGYQICKAYYDRAADKKQAIYDMLHIRDYTAFYEKSGVDGQLYH